MDSLQVLLVDDEYLAIEDLKSMVDWEALGYHIAGASHNGKQALHIADREKLDIIITDISMPGMDGIELIRQIRRKQPRMLFLLLTAYAEIDYMKQAFRLGVEDYLMKDEITSDSLSAKLTDIRDKYLSDLRLNYTYIQKSLHHAFLDSNAAMPEDVLSVLPSAYSYLVIAPDILFPWVEDQGLQERYPITKRLADAQVLCESFRDAHGENLYVFQAYNNKLVMLLKVPPTNSGAQVQQSVYRFTQALHRHFTEHMAESFSLFYHPQEQPLDKLHRDYFCRQKTLRARYFLENRQVRSLDDPDLFITNTRTGLTETKLNALMEEDPDQLLSFTEDLFQTILSRHNYLGLSEYTQVYFSCIFHSMSVEPDDLKDSDLINARSAHSWVLAQLEQICRLKKHKRTRETQKAIQFISDYYADEHLSVQQIADEAGLSTTHLGRVFKQDTGFTVWDYLTRYRIEQSCKIMEKEDLKIYRVAEMVGYSSSQYFSQVFYKLKGIKPIEYKNKFSYTLKGGAE